MIHACGGGGGGERGWVCLASVSGPMCMFVYVIRVTAKKKKMSCLRTKIKVLKS